MILADLLSAVGDRRSPLLLTGRTNHLKYFETALSGKVSNVFVLKGGMGKKQRRTIAEAIAAVPESESRVILATGSYIGEGFDDARLDTLFLAMPISWKGTLQQYVGRLHRLHEAKHVVRVYDYVDSQVLMLARMYARRLRGYGAIGYRIGAAAAEGPSPSELNASDGNGGIMTHQNTKPVMVHMDVLKLQRDPHPNLPSFSKTKLEKLL